MTSVHANLFALTRANLFAHGTRRFTLLALASAMFLTSNCVEAQQSATGTPQLYSHGDPTNDEQYLLTLLNRARMDPVGEGQRLEAWLNLPQNSLLLSTYSIDPATVASQIAALPAVPPLAFNADLIAAARSHAADLAAHNGVEPSGDEHEGSDGSTPDSRVAASGFKALDGVNDGYYGENTGPGTDSPYETHAAYFVDWGVPDLVHRNMSMNGGGSNVIGIGLATAPASFDNPYSLMETEDYGYPGVVFVNNKLVPAPAPAQLLGVVYTDTNGNDEYDSGEGVAGATVTMDGGYYYTVTSASGGYALPLVNVDGSNMTGPVSVHIAFPNSSDTRAATITVSDYVGTNGPYLANIEWDGMMSAGSINPNPPVATNSALPTISGGGTVAKGSKIKLVVARPASSDLTQPVTVAYKLTGTAVASVDYAPLPGTVSIPAGKETAKIKVTALDNTVTNRPPGVISLLLKLKGVPGAEGKATVTFAP